MADVGNELKRLRVRADYSVRALARELDMPASTYSAYEDKYKKAELPVPLARALAKLLGRRGVAQAEVLALAGIHPQTETIMTDRRGQLDPDQGIVPSMASIEEFDIRGAAGAGALVDDDNAPQVIHAWQIPRDVIRAATYTPADRIKIITVVGDSMEGTFRPFEKVMVDTEDRTPSPPGIFVVYDGLGLVVKRVEYVPHSDPPQVRFTSDNPRYSAYERSLSEAYIQGRVLGRWQWV